MLVVNCCHDRRGDEGAGRDSSVASTHLIVRTVGLQVLAHFKFILNVIKHLLVSL